MRRLSEALRHLSAYPLAPPVCRSASFMGRSSLLVISMVLAAMFHLGCEEGVNPIVGSEYPFTLWGFMNAGADTQYVRVFEISDQLVPDPGDAIDARVFSTDLTTGEEREWSYELVRFDSLIQGHVFWSPFRAVNEHRYELEVVRSDGATSSVVTTVPPEADFQISVDFRDSSTVIPVHIDGDIPNMVGFRVTYHAVNVPPVKAWPIGTAIAPAVQLPVTIGYDNVLSRQGDGWQLEIDMSRDFIAVRTWYEFNCLVTPDGGSAPDVWLRGIEFSVLAADSSWAPPGGTFDPNVLSVPGTFSNVENGYGFFGAGMGVLEEWTPPAQASLAAGYNYEAQCNYLFPLEQPECMDPPVPCLGDNVTDLWRIWLR